VDVTFQKAAPSKDTPPWIAVNGKSRIVGSHLGSDPQRLPHDIVTFVIERELGLVDGFFGTVAAGGTFRSIRNVATLPTRPSSPPTAPDLRTRSIS
jgi:hypothetical protein